MKFSRVPKRQSKTRFTKAPQAGIPRSSFDLSHPHKTTFDSGDLIPVLVQEVLPGDSFRVRMATLTRLATPLHPTMDNLWLESFFFFIPNRLSWSNWQRFMGEQDNPGDSVDFTIPQAASGSTWGEGSMADHFGLPIGREQTSFNALPFRAYNLVYNHWFRDENLQDSVPLAIGDGPDTVSNYQIRRRGKRKDYLSSALPWPQKGPGVDLPLGDTAPIRGIGLVDGQAFPVINQDVIETDGSLPQYTYGAISANIANFMAFEGNAAGTAPAIYADLAQSEGATINDMRMAFQIQKLQERDARGGTRYTEILKSHFQVTSPDSRLQRPEYLGGGRTPILMNSVPQTSETDPQGPDASPQGNLTAYATAIAQNHGFTKSFVEHGYIIGLVNARADLNYQNKIDRMWSRVTKYDFYWPALQALGEQPVYNREIYASGNAETDGEVWGYQERWSEYRSQLGHITGRFRSEATAPLDSWHYALDFGETPPALNDVFVEDNPPVRRTIAVQTEPEFIFDAWFDIKAARPMPIYSVPGYIDHF